MFDSFVIMRQFMGIVVQNLHKKQLHDVHWLCSDICIPTGSTVTTPGWCSPPDVYGPAKSTVRNSVEEISLHSDVIEHFIL